MKEYIYLDTELVNSYLAQLDEGILTKMITGASTTDSNSEENGKDIRNTTTGGMSAYFASGKHEYTKAEMEKYSSVYSENNSELIETALNDYSLDVLLTKLSNNQLIKSHGDDWVDGDIVTVSDETAFFNFESLKESSKEENLRYVIKKSEELIHLENELERLTTKKNRNKTENVRLQSLKASVKAEKAEDGMENFKHVENFGTYMSVLFPKSILTKTSNVLSLCEKENLRVNESALSFYALSKRKFKVLGIVISEHKKSIVPKNGEQVPTYEIVSSATTMFMDIMLTSFELLDLGDYFIRPIAIYYEKE